MRLLLFCIKPSHENLVQNQLVLILYMDKEVLYQLFEWTALPNSKVILIGIANALDLADRILPRLQTHITCRPQLLHFPPYTKDQIIIILRERLGSNSELVIDPMAVQFCARKVAAVHGDLRKALGVCRRAVELASQECSKAVHVSHIASVVSGSTTNYAARNAIPLQQKLVVCDGEGKAKERGFPRQVIWGICQAV